MFNWIVSDTYQYLEVFNIVNLCSQNINIWYVMYKPDLALNNLQRLICRKTKPKQSYAKLVYIYIYVCVCVYVLFSVVSCY